MKNALDNEFKFRRLAAAARIGELHGDGNCAEWAEAMRQPDLRRRADLAAAREQCRDWLNAPAAAPAWRRVREGIFGLGCRLNVSLRRGGRIVAGWGDAAYRTLPVLDPALPQLVTLGESDDLPPRAGVAEIEAGAGRPAAALHFLSSRQGRVCLEIRLGARGPEAAGPWSAELWRGGDLFQRLPGEGETVRFTKSLSAGSYRVILRRGGDRYEIGIEVV